MKPCRVCEELFAPKSSRNVVCGTCRLYRRAEAQARYKKGNQKYLDSFNEARLVRRWGLTKEQREDLLAKQGGVCKVCSAPEPGGKYNKWNVDHDHSCCPGNGSCGKCIRGLLCSRCNLTLGNARDSEELLLAMVRYLRDFGLKEAI